MIDLGPSSYSVRILPQFGMQLKLNLPACLCLLQKGGHRATSCCISQQSLWFSSPAGLVSADDLLDMHQLTLQLHGLGGCSPLSPCCDEFCFAVQVLHIARFLHEKPKDPLCIKALLRRACARQVLHNLLLSFPRVSLCMHARTWMSGQDLHMHLFHLSPADHLRRCLRFETALPDADNARSVQIVSEATP